MSYNLNNPFALLAMDSDSEGDPQMAAALAPAPSESLSVPASPPFRVWQQPNSRFRGDKSTLFSSPFKKAHNSKSDEGWVSIRDKRWNQPQFEDDIEGFDLEKESLTSETLSESQDMREIVLGHVVETTTYSLSEGIVDAPKQESMTAVAWAERIKKSLEKAEAARAEKAKLVDPEDFKEALGRLSFFRRPLAMAESSS
jgi:hypothetical protein